MPSRYMSLDTRIPLSAISGQVFEVSLAFGNPQDLLRHPLPDAGQLRYDLSFHMRPVPQSKVLPETDQCPHLVVQGDPGYPASIAVLAIDDFTDYRSLLRINLAAVLDSHSVRSPFQVIQNVGESNPAQFQDYIFRLFLRLPLQPSQFLLYGPHDRRL